MEISEIFRMIAPHLPPPIQPTMNHAADCNKCLQFLCTMGMAKLQGAEPSADLKAVAQDSMCPQGFALMEIAAKLPPATPLPVSHLDETADAERRAETMRWLEEDDSEKALDKRGRLGVE